MISRPTILHISRYNTWLAIFNKVNVWYYKHVLFFRSHQGIISLSTKLLLSQETCVFPHILQLAFHDSAVASITVVSGVKMDTIIWLKAQNTKSDF